jgi:hypothetical protein
MNKKLFLLALLTFIICSTRITLAEETVRQQFERKYNAWKDYISRPPVSFSSTASTRYECDQYREIIKMGIPAIPYIIEKVSEDRWIGAAINKIMKMDFHAKYNKDKNLIEFPDLPEYKSNENIYLYWWKEGRRQTPQRFEKLYTEWKSLKKQGKGKEAKEKIQKMQDLGIDAMPNFIEKISKDNVDLIPTLEYLTDGEVNQKEIKVLSTNKAKSKHCVDWWNKNKDKWTIKE